MMSQTINAGLLHRMLEKLRIVLVDMWTSPKGSYTDCPTEPISMCALFVFKLNCLRFPRAWTYLAHLWKVWFREFTNAVPSALTVIRMHIVSHTPPVDASTFFATSLQIIDASNSPDYRSFIFYCSIIYPFPLVCIIIKTQPDPAACIWCYCRQHVFLYRHINFSKCSTNVCTRRFTSLEGQQLMNFHVISISRLKIIAVCWVEHLWALSRFPAE